MAQDMRFADNDPRRHAAQLRGALREIGQHARDDAVKADNDPRARGLFETTAEVLRSLDDVYALYERQRRTG